jgi:hypothetical protein
MSRGETRFTLAGEVFNMLLVMRTSHFPEGDHNAWSPFGEGGPRAEKSIDSRPRIVILITWRKRGDSR